MRRLVEYVMAGSALAVCVAAYLFLRPEGNKALAVEQVQQDVLRLGSEIKLRAATNGTELNGRGWPITIYPGWFSGNPPRNTLLTKDRPWLDVAPMADAHLTHPEVRVALTKDMPSFWYNPYNGAVRARVPSLISDKQTLDLYNEVNACDLSGLFFVEASPKSSTPQYAQEAGAAPAPAAAEQPGYAELDPPKDNGRW